MRPDASPSRPHAPSRSSAPDIGAAANRARRATFTEKPSLQRQPFMRVATGMGIAERRAPAPLPVADARRPGGGLRWALPLALVAGFSPPVICLLGVALPLVGVTLPISGLALAAVLAVTALVTTSGCLALSFWCETQESAAGEPRDYQHPPAELPRRPEGLL